MQKRRVWLLLIVGAYYLLYLSTALILLEPTSTADYIDMCFEGSLLVTSFTLLSFFQRFKGPKNVYTPIVLGLILTGFYNVSDILDEIRVFPRYLIYVVDDFCHLISLLFIIVGVSRWLRYNNGMLQELKALATTDGLTGVANRQHIDSVLEDQRLSALRYDRFLSVVLLDIDTFKRIYDTFGHSVGDVVLKEMAALIGSMIRETDYFGRYGGEEFLLVLPETNLTDAQLVAEKIRQAVEEHPFPKVKSVTSSFGVACLKADESLRDFVHRADEALYASKSGGRNRVTITG